jgi:hypothetical protein
MKNKQITLLITLVFFTLNSCITIQGISISDVNPDAGKYVKASSSGLGFLHLGVPRGLVEKTTYDLKNKGVTGNISTVLTIREWGIVQFYKVTASGTLAPK